MLDIPVPEVGQRVAVYQHRSFDPYVSFARVERLTTTQIALDNGDKYRIKNHRRVGDDYYASPELFELDAPEVVRARADRIMKNTARRVDEHLRRKSADSVGEMLVLLDDARAMIEAAYVALHELLSEPPY